MVMLNVDKGNVYHNTSIKEHTYENLILAFGNMPNTALTNSIQSAPEGFFKKGKYCRPLLH